MHVELTLADTYGHSFDHHHPPADMSAYTPFCDFAWWAKCSKVLMSPYGRVLQYSGLVSKEGPLDVPNPILGVGFYWCVEAFSPSHEPLARYLSRAPRMRVAHARHSRLSPALPSELLTQLPSLLSSAAGDPLPVLALPRLRDHCFRLCLLVLAGLHPLLRPQRLLRRVRLDVRLQLCVPSRHVRDPAHARRATERVI